MRAESPEFQCWFTPDEPSTREKGRYLLKKFGGFIRERVIDLGCGEGALLLALAEIGKKNILGVELNAELAVLARSFGLPVVQKDILQFLREVEPEVATYFYLDVIEHVTFDDNLELLRLLPVGSRLIIQTPNTESLLGHQFYFNVPSHVAPYSPVIIRRILARFGYDIVSEGSVDGRHPDSWKRNLRILFARKVLGIPEEMIVGGGNYFVVADRNRDGGAASLPVWPIEKADIW